MGKPRGTEGLNLRCPAAALSGVGRLNLGFYWSASNTLPTMSLLGVKVLEPGFHLAGQA